MTIKERNSRLIDIDETTAPTELLEHTIYSDDYAALPKDKQLELFMFCKMYANREVCQENLKQMRYAIADLYFGI